MKLSKNFTSTELCVSSDFPELAAAIEPTEVEKGRAELLALSCAQPLRDKFGKLTVLSWLRSKALNRMIHEGKNTPSDHLLAIAVDLYSVKHSAEELFEYAVGICLPYRQVIVYPDRNFLHISCNIPGRAYRHSALICRRGKYMKLDKDTEMEYKFREWLHG